MARAGLTRESVIGTALELVDVAGPDGFATLTLSALAQRTGVAVPSLYKHVASLADLRQAMGVEAVRDLTRTCAQAAIGRSGDDAVSALAHAIRDFAKAHPARYAAAQSAAGFGDNPDHAEAAAETVRVIASVLRGYAIPSDRMVDAIRAIRSAVHGFVMLELGGGFGMPDDLDDSFDSLVGMLTSGLKRAA
ncbi:TetR/AcrR family transcriptional regulator [Salinibacterium sp. ZJ450]|uniref:TetR/AcrR family transcriptional regulator n=1 Tax=Salinibacterium sp. ZJ450 TaxID=2708338 RepID=UPI00174B5F98|nr:TetR/AcrR family transcriptional regulator [Salinibacterium sp. ZJ450]